MRKESNSRKRDAIIQMLEQSGGTQAFLKRLESFTDHEFNEFLFVNPRVRTVTTRIGS